MEADKHAPRLLIINIGKPLVWYGAFRTPSLLHSQPLKGIHSMASFQWRLKQSSCVQLIQCKANIFKKIRTIVRIWMADVSSGRIELHSTMVSLSLCSDHRLRANVSRLTILFYISDCCFQERLASDENFLEAASTHWTLFGNNVGTFTWKSFMANEPLVTVVTTV